MPPPHEERLNAMTIRTILCGALCAFAFSSTGAPLQGMEPQMKYNATLAIFEEDILIPSEEFGDAIENARANKYERYTKSPSFTTPKGADSHFSWGADAGSSVDMSATGMSAIDLNINVGYKGSYVRFLGLGAGITTMIENSSRLYPIYAQFRSSFAKRPRFCFLDLRAGAAFCNINDFATQVDFYGSLGLGITLAHSRRFSSHIILAYTFVPLTGEVRHQFDNFHFATLRLGVAF